MAKKSWKVGDELEWSFAAEAKGVPTPDGPLRPSGEKERSRTGADSIFREGVLTGPEDDSIFREKEAPTPAIIGSPFSRARSRVGGAERLALEGSAGVQATRTFWPRVRFVVLALGAVVLLRKDLHLSFALDAPATRREAAAAPVGSMPGAFGGWGLSGGAGPKGYLPNSGVGAEEAVRAYLWRYAPVAVAEMRRTGVPAGLHLALGLWAARSAGEKERGHAFPYVLPVVDFPGEWSSWPTHGDRLKAFLPAQEPAPVGSWAWVQALYTGGVLDARQRDHVRHLMRRYTLDRYDDR